MDTKGYGAKLSPSQWYQIIAYNAIRNVSRVFTANITQYTVYRHYLKYVIADISYRNYSL